MSEDYNSVFSR